MGSKPQLLYSTNPWLKWYIHKYWRGDMHFVWCSAVFDPRKRGAEDRGSLIPPTSSPAAIYSDLAGAASSKGRERHNDKINKQRASLTARAEAWREAGEITVAQANEILAILAAEDPTLWRPLLYVIPTGGIDARRIELVPYGERAGLGEEFRIRDLAGSEFDRIDFDEL